MTDAAEGQGKKPIEKLKAGAVTAAIFGDERTTKTGEKFTAYSVSITRTFTRDDGKTFEHTSSIDDGNLSNVVMVAEMAQKWIANAKATKA